MGSDSGGCYAVCPACAWEYTLDDRDGVVTCPGGHIAVSVVPKGAPALEFSSCTTTKPGDSARPFFAPSGTAKPDGLPYQVSDGLRRPELEMSFSAGGIHSHCLDVAALGTGDPK